MKDYIQDGGCGYCAAVMYLHRGHNKIEGLWLSGNRIILSVMGTKIKMNEL